MSGDQRPRDVKDLWQGQPADGTRVPLDELRRRSRRLERLVGWRNLREYIGAVVVVVGFGRVAWFAETPLIRAGACLWVAAAVFVAYHLHRWGSAQPMPEQMALTGCLQFHRSALERQRDLLRSVWKWYLLPCLPGLLVFNIGLALAHPERLSALITTAALVAPLTVVIVLLNTRGANRIQARIDALESDV